MSNPVNGNYHFRCILCDGHLAWDSASNACDTYGDYDGDEDAVVNYFHCLNCGRSYEIVDPVKEERELNYKPYWSGEKR